MKKGLAADIEQYTAKLSMPTLTVFGLILIAVLGAIDYLTGPELSFSIFYLIPIVFVSWLSGNKLLGLLISGISAVTWLIADITAGHIYSHPAIPYWNMVVRLGFFCIITVSIVKLKHTLEHEKMLSRIDPLTGASNVRFFAELAKNEIDRARRYNHPFTFAYIDLDNFKAVNDSSGHSTGDILLQLVVNTIKNNIRATDIIARLGGDEFAVFLPETGYEDGNTAVMKIQKSLIECMEKNRWPVTFSIGVFTFISPPATVDEMIKISDSLMYGVKAAGKNAVRHEIFAG